MFDSEWGRSAGMGTVRIRHYRVRKGRGYWEPTAKMKALGFRVSPLGPDGPEAWAKAERLNSEWDLARKSGTPVATYEHGTLGWLHQKYRTMDVWAKKEARTREEWDLAWRVIQPVFADVRADAIDFPACDAFYTELGRAFSLHKQHRVFKIFRALLEVAIGFRLIAANPTHKIANSAPKGRKAIWYEDEVATLRDRAWEMGYRGLAVAIAIAYDTQMAPVDVRQLTGSMRVTDGQGVYFETARAKTSRDVIATLSNDTVARIDAYIAGLGFSLPPDQPFIRNRSGHVYSKDTLGDDFRDVRGVVFPGDARRLMDLRRTGNVEAIAGGAEPAQLSAKLSNTLSQSNQIFDTYSPVQLATVRETDKARIEGRRRMRLSHIVAGIHAEQDPPQKNKSGNFPTKAPARESEQLEAAGPTDARKKNDNK